MLRIRLSRGGKKRQPHYRVVVANVESKRDGRVVERIGHYTPLTNPPTYKIDESRALYWISVGAQPSDAVKRLLEKQGTYDRLQRLRAGESMAELIAEYEGVTLTPEPEAVKSVKAKAVTPAEVITEETGETETMMAVAAAEETVDEAVMEDEPAVGESVVAEESEPVAEAEADVTEEVEEAFAEEEEASAEEDESVEEDEPADIDEPTVEDEPADEDEPAGENEPEEEETKPE